MQSINRSAFAAVIVLSLVILVAVLTGFFQPPQADEGSAAHVFQLASVALVPALVVFFTTMHRNAPWKTVRMLAFPVSTLVLAFCALYYLERFR